MSSGNKKSICWLMDNINEIDMQVKIDKLLEYKHMDILEKYMDILEKYIQPIKNNNNSNLLIKKDYIQLNINNIREFDIISALKSSYNDYNIFCQYIDTLQNYIKSQPYKKNKDKNYIQLNINNINEFNLFNIIELSYIHNQIDVFREYIDTYPDNINYNDENICNFIAVQGDLETLKWAIKKGFLWTVNTANNAIEHNHFELFKWAYNNGCPIDETTFLIAQKYTDILDWLFLNVWNNLDVVKILVFKSNNWLFSVKNSQFKEYFRNKFINEQSKVEFVKSLFPNYIHTDNNTVPNNDT
jgi:hypothetical protein